MRGRRIIWNSAIDLREVSIKARAPMSKQCQPTVNAVPMVSSLPWAIYVKNAVTETRIGAHVQMSERQMEFTHAVLRSSDMTLEHKGRKRVYL